jgi:hypothetical protein
MAREAGFDTHELFGRGRGGKGGKVPPKYRDPKNPANTWTGRGRKPRWLAAATKRDKAKVAEYQERAGVGSNLLAPGAFEDSKEVVPMSTTLEIKNGPSKADLLRSVTNVAKGLTTTFETDSGPIEAQIESLDESPNGVDFMLTGYATSPILSGIHFRGVYNIEEKAGRLRLG